MDSKERLERARQAAREEHDKIMSQHSSAISSLTPLTTTANFMTLPNFAILNRIYIGSIQFDITEPEIKAIFSAYGSVKSINMMIEPVQKRHRGYGFIEFETAEAAQLAQEMDKTQLASLTIKVGRPSNFPPTLPAGVPRPLPNRIYVSNIHELIKEEEARAIFEAFGPLLHCNLVPDTQTRQHKGYGYVEFEREEHATAAVQALHGFELAGRQLKVGHTIVGGPIPPGMTSLADGSGPVKPRVPTAVLRAAQEINKTIVGEDGSIASATVLLGNLDDYEETSKSPDLLEELEQDILEECQRFGKVLKCQASLNGQLRDVQVSVRFSDSLEAAACLKVMDGRWFGGRQVKAILIPDS